MSVSYSKTNQCVSCGRYISEDRQVCTICEKEEFKPYNSKRLHEEGNPEAIDIVAIMKKFNFSYAGSNITNCYIIKPINAVEYIYSKYGSKVLNNTLGII